MWRGDLMCRPWPTFVRIGISVVVVTLLFWPVADYKWTIFLVEAFDPAKGSDPVYVTGPVSDVTAAIAEYTWRLSMALPEAVFGSLAGIVVFVLLGRLFGIDHPRETLCAHCGHILRGLREARCPACGEPL
jgi:hypothetical protein